MSGLIDQGQVRTVAVVGCGTIGASWITWFVAQGFAVRAFDADPTRERFINDYITQAWPAMVELDISDLDISEAVSRVSFHARLDDAVAGVDFVQENIYEKLEEKRKILAAIDDVLPTNVVISSSTSGLKPSLIQSEMRRAPQRFVVGHPFNPPHLIPLVEVIGGVRSAPATVEWALQFYRFIGKVAIHLKKEVDGHLANRLQMSLWREAVYMIDQDVASVEDVDAAVKFGPGLRWAIMGPALTFHMAGGAAGLAGQLNHFGDSVQRWWDDLGNPMLTQSLKDKLVSGVNDEIGKRTYSDLATERDRKLKSLLKL